MEKFILSDDERELIEAIRNFRKSKHNPSERLEDYAHQIFNDLMYNE